MSQTLAPETAYQPQVSQEAVGLPMAVAQLTYKGVAGTMNAIKWVATNYYETAMISKKHAAAVLIGTTALAGGIQTNFAMEHTQPEGCSDLAHEQLYVPEATDNMGDAYKTAADHLGLANFSRSWSNFADNLSHEREQTVTVAGLMSANPDSPFFERDEDGNLVENIKPGSYCIALPAPIVKGINATSPGENLTDIAAQFGVTVDEIVSYNPQLSNAETQIVDPAVELPAGTLVKVAESIDTSLVLRPSRGTLAEEASIDPGMLPELQAANGFIINNGGAINTGIDAYLPPVATSWTLRHDALPTDAIDLYATLGAYEALPAPGATLVSAEPLTNEATPTYAENMGLPEVANIVTMDVAQQMMPATSHETMVDLYPRIIRALDEQGMADEQMVLFTFATMSVEVAEGLPIQERGVGPEARYWPYIGSGYIQLTWDYNYAKYGDIIGVDLINNPELALEPDTAARILAAFIKDKEPGIRAALNEGNFEQARAIINGRRPADAAVDPGKPNHYREFTNSFQIGQAAADTNQAEFELAG